MNKTEYEKQCGRLEEGTEEFCAMLDRLTKQETDRLALEETAKRNIRKRLFKKYMREYEQTDVYERLSDMGFDIVWTIYNEIMLVDDHYERYQLTKQSCIILKNLFEKLSKIC